jgi:outer membrane receptor protein involved in Fe transport
VLGAEWRDEKVSATPPDENRLGYTFANKFGDEHGEQNVTEVFAEVDIPLVVESRFAKYLALDAAVRFSDYSTTGDATTWKTGLVWQPLESLTFRATIAEATRAPSVQELFALLGQTFWDITDPCDINNLVNGTSFREDNCSATLTALGIDPTTYLTPSSLSVSGLNGGNPDLDQETSDTVTFGLIFAPDFIEGLTISADWYDIKLEDAIEFSSPEQAANLCVDLAQPNNEFCDLITRGSDGGIVDFIEQPQNVAVLSTKGIDFNITYNVDLSSLGASANWGAVNFVLTVNNLVELKTTSLPGTAPVSNKRQPNAPEWQANFDVQWQLPRTLIRWQVHYFDETNRFDNTTTRNNPNIVAPRYLQFERKLTHDLYGSFMFSEQLSVYIGVNNVTDEQPDVGSIFYPVSAVGRYLFAGVRFTL